MARHDREKSQECEQYINRIYALQQELIDAKDESRRFQSIIERLQNSKEELELQVHEKTIEIDILKEEVRKLREISRRQRDEDVVNGQVIEALNQELTEIRNNYENHAGNRPRSQTTSSEIELRIYSEIEQELKRLKNENKILKEANEELQAQLLNNHLEEGRSLLKEGETFSSLASELNNLSNEQVSSVFQYF